MNTDILVPITFLICLLVSARYWINYQKIKRQQWHESFRQALNSAHAPDALLMKKLAKSVDPKANDLRKAILFIALSLALLLVGLFVPFQDREGNHAVMTVAILPAIFGLTYLGLWLVWYRD